jgi:hypothetical protein
VTGTRPGRIRPTPRCGTAGSTSLPAKWRSKPIARPRRPLPTDACKIYSIAYDGHPLVYVTLENLTSKEGADWATVTGDPAYWLNLSSTAATASIWLYPKPAATLAGGIVYYHSYYPAALTDGATADATEIDLPSQGLNAAMWRTLIFAGIRDFENPAARARLAEYRAEYQQALKQVKESVALPHAGPYYVTEYDASYE